MGKEFTGSSYPEEVMARIREKSDIIETASRFLEVKKGGKGAYADCPFHEGDEGTLLFSEKEQTYACHDCGASGDVFSFVMEYKGVSLKEAAEYLAGQAGIRLPEPERRAAMDHVRSTILAENLEAARFYHRNMGGQDKDGLAYMHGRGVDNHTIRSFGIGYAPDRPGALYRHLKSKGYTDEQIGQSGLVTFHNGRAYDKFRGRIMCPVVDTDRHVLGFSGRIVKDAEGQPKYKNSPETPAFDKKTVLYGLNLAKDSSRQGLILCEGNLDVVSMHQAGFDNAVASLGTAFSKEHAMILKEYTDHVHLAFDSDGPGVRAAMNAIPVLREQGIAADVVHLEPYKDPDEFLKAEGPHEFQKRIGQAETALAFEVRTALEKYDLSDPAQEAEAYKGFAAKLPGLPENLRDDYIRAFRDYISPGKEEPSLEEERPAGDADEAEAQVEEERMDDGGSTKVVPIRQEPENHRPEAAYIDTSWLDDYSL